jgi:hypothetical protein
MMMLWNQFSCCRIFQLYLKPAIMQSYGMNFMLIWWELNFLGFDNNLSTYASFLLALI